MQDFGIYLSGATAIALIGAAIKFGYTIRDIRAKAAEDNAEVRKECQAAIADSRTAQAENMERMRHETGEMGSALRQKIHEVETWNRDTFVRKDSFEIVIGRLEKSIDKLGDRMDERLERIAERIINGKPD